jgi:threonine/homoserine/homoserine lactone efflux protein
VNFPSFLASVVVVSLSGVMMPGPVFAATVAKGQGRPGAGALIGLGHGIVEFPLVILIYAGLGPLFALPWWKTAVGLVGGAVLLMMGVGMIRHRGDRGAEARDLPHQAVAAGAVTTATNPYFYIWWASVGAVLVTQASAWGWKGLLAFLAVHWACDVGWSLVVSHASHHGARIWSDRVHRLVFSLCGLLLLGFGGWFLWGAARVIFSG